MKKIFPLLFVFGAKFSNAQTFQYDAKNQLTKITYSNGASILYIYDELGNRISETKAAAIAETASKQAENNTTVQCCISLRPNPVSNILYISGLTNTTNSFEIINMLGATIKRWQNTAIKQLDISNLTTGFYLLHINGKEVLKFVKQ